MHEDELAGASSWIAYRRWTQITLLGMIAAWWAAWDFKEGALTSRLPIYLSRFDPTLIQAIAFWAIPIGGIAAIQLICYALDGIFLDRRWTPLDLLRLALWKTVSPTVALLFVSTGFEAIYKRQLMGMLWLIIAAILAILGPLRLRSAEGLRLKEVKSGELYKRALVLAKVTKTPLKRVCVVPAGRGHLTNAYGGSHVIAVTDNYGKFLTSAQLDFVIGHELAHAKAKHGRKKLLLIGVIFTALILAVFIMPPFLLRFRPFLDVLIVLVPVLAFYCLSRRFEYAADAAGVELTQDPETAIHALVNLYRITKVPGNCGLFTQLFLTHPALTRRARAIGVKAGISSDRISQVVGNL